MGDHTPPAHRYRLFARIDSIEDRFASENVNDGINVSVYPDSPSGDNTLIRRDGNEPVAVFKSFVKSGANRKIDDEAPISYCEFRVPEPRRTTSIATMIIGFNVYDGSGGFDDVLRPMCVLKATFDDGSAWAETYRIGERSRTVYMGSLCDAVYYTAPLTDPFSGQAWSGVSGSRTYFLDVQELVVPEDKRA